MLIENDSFSKFSGINKFHDAGYFGERVVAASGEAFNAKNLQALGYNAVSPISDYVSDSSHPFQTALTFFQVAPKAKLISIPYADNYPINGKSYSFIKDAIPIIKQFEIITMFTSCEGRPDATALDAALSELPNFFYAMSN